MIRISHAEAPASRRQAENAEKGIKNCFNEKPYKLSIGRIEFKFNNADFSTISAFSAPPHEIVLILVRRAWF
jgi:hypothetical protein